MIIYNIKFLQVSPLKNHIQGYQDVNLLSIQFHVFYHLRIHRYKSYLLRLKFVCLFLRLLPLFFHLNIDYLFIIYLTQRTLSGLLGNFRITCWIVYLLFIFIRVGLNFSYLHFSYSCQSTPIFIHRSTQYLNQSTQKSDKSFPHFSIIFPSFKNILYY